MVIGQTSEWSRRANVRCWEKLTGRLWPEEGVVMPMKRLGTLIYVITMANSLLP